MSVPLEKVQLGFQPRLWEHAQQLYGGSKCTNIISARSYDSSLWIEFLQLLAVKLSVSNEHKHKMFSKVLYRAKFAQIFIVKAKTTYLTQRPHSAVNFGISTPKEKKKKSK